MFKRLKHLTNLRIVASVFQKPTAYPDVSQGFVRDQQNLRQNAYLVVRSLNQNVSNYGKEYSN